MTAILVGLLLLTCVRCARGLLGGLVGGFLGGLVLAGMASMAVNGGLAAAYSPIRLASSALCMAAVAAVLALVVPHATGFASLGWGAGALLAAIAAAGNGEAVYVVPLAVHALAA